MVNVSSTGGLTGAAFMTAYCTSKGAVTLFSKCAAIEFGVLGYNIRVNSIHPGGIGTSMLDEIFDAYVRLGAVMSREDATAAVKRDHPIGRLGRPEEIAAGIVHLCSPASSFMTGSAMVVDGGFTAH